MYHEYFGLTEPAFSIAVNPKYLYMSSQHKEALAHLVYGVQGGGFVLLSGEVGTGKTTIVRCLLERMPGDTEIAFVLNPMADVDELLATICEELKIELSDGEDTSTKIIMDKLQQHLLENHAKNKRTVLLIDEAQLLSPDVLEQIRLLTNLETSTDKLLQIVLVGQPEVNELLGQPRLRQLSQRITARFHLEALTLAETEKYIEHRLHVAGKQDGLAIFPNEIIKKIHRFSGGIPRLINILCERLLVGAYGYNKFEVDVAIYNRALKEVEGVKLQTPSPSIALANPLQSSNILFFCASATGIIFLIIALWIVLKPSTNENARSSILLDAQNLNSPASNSPNTATPQAPLSASDLSQFEQIELRSSGSITRLNRTQNGNLPSYILDNTRAFAKIFTYHGLFLNNENHPCWQTDQHDMSCSKAKVETWQELQSINRPVILTLVTADKTLAYSVLVGLNNNEAFVLDGNNKVISVPRYELAASWNGSIVYLWRKPEGYERPLTQGTRSPAVKWVAEQFALIDGQNKPITGEDYSKRLQTRVKIFQASVGLERDGILGERTLMKLNDALGLGIDLIDQAPSE